MEFTINFVQLFLWPSRLKAIPVDAGVCLCGDLNIYLSEMRAQKICAERFSRLLIKYNWTRTTTTTKKKNPTIATNFKVHTFGPNKINHVIHAADKLLLISLLLKMTRDIDKQCDEIIKHTFPPRLFARIIEMWRGSLCFVGVREKLTRFAYSSPIKLLALIVSSNFTRFKVNLIEVVV